MFEEFSLPEQKTPGGGSLKSVPSASSGKRRLILMIIPLAVATLLAAGGGWYLISKKRSAETASPTPAQVASEPQSAKVAASSTLPAGAGENQNYDETAADGSLIKAENLSFAQFYQVEKDDFIPSPSELKLPFDVKTQAANYYDLARKIDLEKYQRNLNENGLAIIDNPFAGNADDFYQTYDTLIKKELPQLITSDFLIYYFENRLKEAFKEVENNVFYQDLWKINKSFFDIASARYRKRRDRIGVVNDPILEGERLEAAYFAIGLELLKPKDKQVSETLGEKNEGKFSAKEAADFDFTAPDYLAEEVAKEVSSITEAKEAGRSPIFFYERDYRDFKIPTGYQKTAKLANFYLASRWLNSVFPLYYRSADCRDCLVDKNDWLRSQIAAAFITRDFVDNQQLKNQWAKIYKILAFFRGIKKELTYLHYQEVLAGLYGDNYQVEKIFAGPGLPTEPADIETAMAAAEKIQAEVGQGFNFSPLEGGLSRSDPASRPQIGMRMLQEPYWPNDYLFGALTGDSAGRWLGKKDGGKYDNQPITACEIKRTNSMARCSGIGLDVINLLYPLPASNDYFIANANYKDYRARASSLSAELGKFSIDSWHSNNYWTTLDIVNKGLLKPEGLTGPINTASGAWKEHATLTSLGGWVNLQLGADQFGANAAPESGGLGGSYEVNGFVEPNLELINELMANTKMLSQMFLTLRFGHDIDFTSKKLNDLYEELDKMKIIVKKELTQQEPDQNDQLAMGDLIKQARVLRAADKTISFNFAGKNQTHDISGVKLLILAYKAKDKLFLVSGPVFNYRER